MLDKPLKNCCLPALYSLFSAAITAAIATATAANVATAVALTPANAVPSPLIPVPAFIIMPPNSLPDAAACVPN